MVNLDLPVCRKKGLTDGFTLVVTQGPIPRPIKAETRKLAVHYVSDIALRNNVKIILKLQLLTQAGGQESDFFLCKQLVGLNILMYIVSCLRFPHCVRIILSARMGDLPGFL